MTTAGAILLVDDEPQFVRALKPGLGAAGYEVTTVDTGAAALSHLAADHCDAVLLDLGLPDMDGKDVARRIREWSSVPLIVLSARDTEEEKVAALDAGADDFVNKPFGLPELLARIRASMRGRERRISNAADFEAGALKVNFATRRAFVEGEEVRLTPREYDLLRTLARHSGRVVTHKQLIAAIWGPESTVDPQFVRVLVGQVRQKLEADPSAPKILLTEPGIGYRLADP